MASVATGDSRKTLSESSTQTTSPAPSPIDPTYIPSKGYRRGGIQRRDCEDCRERKIRCKHCPVPKKPMTFPLDLSASYNLSVKRKITDSGEAYHAQAASIHHSTSRMKRGEACSDCRKSKRQCIHDASGNIDVAKAAEKPVMRKTSGPTGANIDAQNRKPLYVRPECDER
jgi:hypothetical protein